MLPKVAATCEDERRAQRRQAMIQAAAPLFAELGYTDCDMERVAAVAGIAKGTLYLYFPGKQELFFSCVDWGMRQMQLAVRTAAESTPEPFQRIARGIRAYLLFFEEHPEYVELLIQERAIFKDRQQSTYFKQRDANRGPWRQLYVELIAAGRFRSDLTADRIVDTIGNLLYGTMFTNHFAGRSVSLDEQYTTLLEIVFRGVLSDSERQVLLAVGRPPENPSAG